MRTENFLKALLRRAIGGSRRKTSGVLSRDRLLDEIWGIDYNGTDRSVDTIIKQLRLKLGTAGRDIGTHFWF